MAPHRDIELNTLNALKFKEDSLAQGSTYSMREPDYDESVPTKKPLEHFFDSFKRDRHSTFFPNDHLGQAEEGPLGREHDGAHYYDLRLAVLESANAGLARKLKGRHLQMIAIGGSIGTPHKSPAASTGQDNHTNCCCMKSDLTPLSSYWE
jgi:yeast amino acid transporter